MPDANSSVPAPVEYRPIPGFPGYRVGDDGSIWTSRYRSRTSTGIFAWIIGDAWTVMKPCKRKWVANSNWTPISYPQVTLSRLDGIRSVLLVHAIVLEAFVGPCPPGMECRHLDGIPMNVALWNLCWGTRKQNADDRAKHGKTRGEKHYRAVLTEALVTEAKLRRANGESFTSIAADMNVSRQTISDAIRGINWKCLL